MPEDDKPRGGSPADKPAGKAKLPSAQGIKRPDFTPHGISSGAKGRGPKPSALTAAQAKKRQRVMIGLVLVAVLAIAGGTTWYVTRPGPKLEVSGAFGKEPTVKNLDKVEPTGKVKVTETIPGKGPKLTNGDTAFVHLTFYKFPAAAAGTDSPTPAESPKGKADGKLGSTYQQGQGPAPMNLGSKDLQGIDKTLSGALTGRSNGSRLLVEVPPASGFGKEGNTQLGITGDDTMLFVLDVVAAFPKNSGPAGEQKKFEKDGLPTVEAGKPGEGPKVTMPKDDPPKKLATETLIEGTGPALAKGDSAVVNYQGQIWKGGKVFDSSWKRGGVTSFSIGTGATVPGFDKGLTGVKIGSRVMLVLPPAEGYGKQGNQQAGIKGTDTLVFIVDVLGKLPK
jgi:FKBP-type peptidyl-prolyl cis-trans isomerase